MVNISYSVSFPEDTAPTPPPKLWAFCGVEMIPAPDEAVLLRRQDDDRRHFVRRDVAAVLNACQHFQTLEVHAQNAGEVIPELKGHPEHVLPVLQQMTELGFLRSADEVFDRIASDTKASSTTLAPPKAFIITCDRPKALQRLLISLAERDHGCSSITIIDDSRQPASQEANAKIIEEAAPRTRSALRYFGAAERSELLSQLESALPHHESSLRFLLDQERWQDLPTYGLARNIALLLSAGERAIVLDDDILAEAYSPPNGSSNLCFADVNERRVTFFNNRDTMFDAATALDDSPLRLSAATLGHPLSDVVRAYGAEPQSLLGAHAPQWWNLVDSRIATTQCGTWGDPGTGDKAHWVVNLKTDDIEALLALSDSVTSTLSARATFMGYPAPMAMRFGAISQLTGLDHRSLLPPYMPVMRGEDFLFGVMLEKIAPASTVMGLPWGVPHLPVDARDDVNFNGSSAARASLHSLAQWLDKQTVSGRDRVSRLGQLADALRGLCQLTPAEALEQLSAALTQLHVQQLKRLGTVQIATAHSAQAEWASYIQRANEELVQTLSNPLQPAKMLSTDPDSVEKTPAFAASRGAAAR
jgi:hypothetical protein